METKTGLRVGVSLVYIMPSLLLFKASTPVFVLKATFQPMGGERYQMAADGKTRKHYVVCVNFLWAMALLCCWPARLRLFLLHKQPYRNPQHVRDSYGKCQWPHPFRKLIHTAQWQVLDYYCSSPSNSNLSDCSAVSCNHHTHTRRKSSGLA